MRSFTPFCIILLSHSYIFTYFTLSIKCQGSLILYSDDECTSPDGSPVSLSLGGCIEANQAAAIRAVSLPFCENGQPLLLISDYEQCIKSSFFPTPSTAVVGYCLSLIAGSAIGSAWFVCAEDVSTPPSSNTAISTFSTINTISTPVVSSTPSNLVPASTAQPYQTQDQQPSGGLSQGEKIALGCAIAFGVPGLIFAFMSWRHVHLSSVHRTRGNPYSGPSDDSPPPYELHDTMQRTL